MSEAHSKHFSKLPRQYVPALHYNERSCWPGEDRACDKNCKHEASLLLFVSMVCFLMAWWPQGLAVSSWQEGSCCPWSRVRTSPTQRWLTPLPLLSGSLRTRRREENCVSWEVIDGVLARQVLWRELDPSWSPHPAQESACVVFTLSGLPMGPTLVTKGCTGSHMEWLCR